MGRLLRKLAGLSLGSDLATSVWRDVSNTALQQRGADLYGTQLLPGFEETNAERLLLLPTRREYQQQVERGERPHYTQSDDFSEDRSDVIKARRGLSFLSKVSNLAWGADDGEFRRYVDKNTNPSGDEYSDQRGRDVDTGLALAWQSHEDFEPGSDTAPVSGKNPILERGPRESKEAAARLKHALQSAQSLSGTEAYPRNAASHAGLTDEQTWRELDEAHDAIEFYAPQSPEGTRGNPVFTPSAKEARHADFSPDPAFREDDEARGLSQWPYIPRDSRQAGKGDDPTSRAWSEHDSFSVTNLPTADAQGNPGPSE